MSLDYAHDYVYQLRKKPGFREAVIARMRENLVHYLPEAYARLGKWMRNSDPDVSLKALRLFLQAQKEVGGDTHVAAFVQNTFHVTVQELEQKSDKELQAMLKSENRISGVLIGEEVGVGANGGNGGGE